MSLIRLTTALLLILCVRGMAQEKKGFTISGKIDGIGNTKVLLGSKPNGYSSLRVRYIDSCMSVNDHFTFKGHIDELDFYAIEVPGKSKDYVYFILGNNEIKITGSKDSIQRSIVTGSPQYDIYKRYMQEVYNPLVKEVDAYDPIIDSLRLAGDLDEAKRIHSEIIRPYERRIAANLYRFVEENPTGFAALYELNSFSIRLPVDSTKKYFSGLSEELKGSSMGKMLKYWLFEYPELIGERHSMFDLDMPDTANHVRELSEFRGKYVLLYFWASGSGPSLDELPEVKRIDNLYRSKGLQVLGISLDTKKDLWTQAIIKHNITWPDLSDLQGTDGILPTGLQITTLPARYLIGPGGNIILKKVSLPEIEKFLQRKLVN
ncbi:TlpA disulfide reductase family protein [Chitinophaga niabensis]|uniref:Peroxiredoxin n=1 Tax=Chitinophaga niabensis TaxID=536979 RepID=A0A1N6J0K9_9BACT|nr:TlpA disulfide reductase family protein [Chitinophaga niabensis]SIO37918.1 Peroxiredoxin [Chitinophaga niabensis]